MRKEIIRSTPSWRNGPPRFDCVFVQTDSSLEGFRGLDVARIKLLFSFRHEGRQFECALVHWFGRVGNEPDASTGMWIVSPEYFDDPAPVNRRQPVPRHPTVSIISVDSILRAAHLIPVYGNAFIPLDISFSNVLDKFNQYFVNKYVDHHAYEIAY